MSNRDNSDLAEIKQRIYEEELVEFILEELECQNIHEINSRFECQLPIRFNSDSRRSVQIKNNEYLSGAIRSRGVKGDIFSVIAYILYEADEFEKVKEHLYQVKAWVCNLLEWDEYLTGRDDFSDEEEKVDHLAFLRPIQKDRKQREKKESLGHKKNKILKPNIINRYFNYSHWAFYKDGILPSTQRFFGVMFDRDSERVVYPLHDKEGNLIGIKGRYVGEDKRILDDIKYLFLYRCDKSIELFNYHRALPYIKDKAEVIVFESAKSCMLAWQWGYRNVVSIEGNELSPIQAMLLKHLGVTIVFAFDKDMGEEHIKKTIKQIKSRVCKAIYDEDNLLEEKDSPVDKGKPTWEKLYQNQKIIR